MLLLHDAITLGNLCLLCWAFSSLFPLLFCSYIIGKHRAYFSKRVPRQNKKSPSYVFLSSLLLSPDAEVLKDWPSIKKDILDISQKSIPEDSVLKKEILKTVEKRDIQIRKKSGKSVKNGNQNQEDKHESTRQGEHVMLKTEEDGEEISLPKLDMDHVNLTLPQLLWTYSFVGLCTFFLYKKGTTMLRIRSFLECRGFIQPTQNFDSQDMVAKLLLESSLAIHYVLTSQETNDENDHINSKPRVDKGDRSESSTRKVATFLFTRFPYINIGGKFQIADLVTVKIDLDSKKMLTCQMDDEELTSSQAMVILFFHWVSAHHAKIHALANWGVNCEDDVKNINHHLHRNSIVTSMYNHAGYIGFGSLIDDGGWERSGLLSAGWTSESLRKVFDHGMKEQIWVHSHIVELVPYSEFVSFIVKVRAMFHHVFSKHRGLFPGVHCEALFAGTIIHSLDHYQAECHLQDPLWLDVNDIKFGKMAEMGRIVRAGFIEDVPGLYFSRRFKDSGHPFYETVYAKAAKVNKRFADQMDTCICK